CMASQPDAVILDMMLPKRSGFLVLEEILSVKSAPTVVMVTANEGKRHMAYANTLGVSAYLIKPVGLDKLIDTVSCLLQEVIE
ncbi:MAG: response regulator, partial [Planctomycetes bacterium]|nr:response regulator [Planctomycetota bacterium]